MQFSARARLRRPYPQAGPHPRTIADLTGAERIQTAHVAEAIHLRSAETDGVMFDALDARDLCRLINAVDGPYWSDKCDVA